MEWADRAGDWCFRVLARTADDAPRNVVSGAWTHLGGPNDVAFKLLGRPTRATNRPVR
jgi:hypothetical protein